MVEVEVEVEHWSQLKPLSALPHTTVAEVVRCIDSELSADAIHSLETKSDNNWRMLPHWPTEIVQKLLCSTSSVFLQRYQDPFSADAPAGPLLQFAGFPNKIITPYAQVPIADLLGQTSPFEEFFCHGQELAPCDVPINFLVTPSVCLNLCSGGWLLVRWAYNTNVLIKASESELAAFGALTAATIARYTGCTLRHVERCQRWCRQLYTTSLRKRLNS